MRKFAVFSGFLGAGKTTAMMALTKFYNARFGGAAMISNDLGRGVTLADHRFALLSGCRASELTDECICFQNENLAARLNAYYAEGCELVISDIPGFGVGALEHVYHGLNEKFPGQFELAPFTVLVEPRTVELLQSGGGGDLRCLCDSQLVEADLIVLNKCDLLGDNERASMLDWLGARYPQAKALALSARKGEGLEELALALREGTASLRRPDFPYSDEVFDKAMGELSEYYLQYHAAVCCNDFDGDAYLYDLGEGLLAGVREAGHALPHGKLLAWEPEGDFGRVDLLGSFVEVNRRFTGKCVTLAVVFNASAACPADTLDKIVTETVETVSAKYQLELMIFKKEFFGMGNQ